MSEYINTQVGDIMGYALEAVFRFIISIIGWWYIWLGIITMLMIMYAIFTGIKRLMLRRERMY